MDSESHAREDDPDTDIEEDGKMIASLTLNVWGYEAHIGIDQTAKPYYWQSRRKGIADGYEIEHEKVADATRKESETLTEHVQIDEGMENVLMEEGIGQTLGERAAIGKTISITAQEGDTHYYNAPSINRNLRFLSS